MVKKIFLQKNQAKTDFKTTCTTLPQGGFNFTLQKCDDACGNKSTNS
jgi:hypothetical protein